MYLQNGPNLDKRTALELDTEWRYALLPDPSYSEYSFYSTIQHVGQQGFTLTKVCIPLHHDAIVTCQRSNAVVLRVSSVYSI